MGFVLQHKDGEFWMMYVPLLFKEAVGKKGLGALYKGGVPKFLGTVFLTFSASKIAFLTEWFKGRSSNSD